MPTSAYEGREFFTSMLSEIDPRWPVVDFGPGEGTYSVLGRHLAPSVPWIGVEIHEPYVERYDLDQKYDEVIISDLRSVNLEPYSVGIFGDVLEHLPMKDAIEVLNWHAGLADWLYVSVPIRPAPQGPSHGNDAEAHLYDWDFDEMWELLDTLGTVSTWRGFIVGRWWVETH